MGSTDSRQAPRSKDRVPARALVAMAENGLSDPAAVFAARIAQRCNATIDLLHVLPMPTLLGMSWSDRDAQAMAADRRTRVASSLRAHLDEVRSPDVDAAGLIERVRTAVGQPAKTVLDEARRTQSDLIVLGTSGRRRELDFGGVARAVLSHAECPVLLVPRSARPVRKLLVPLDLSPASLRGLELARDWARMLGAKLLAIHCFSAPELVAYGVPEAPLAPMDFDLEGLRESTKLRFDRELRGFDWRGVPWDARLVDEAPEEAILEMQDDHDLIVLSTHGHTGLAATLLGSVAYHVLRRTHTPTLALPARAVQA